MVYPVLAEFHQNAFLTRQARMLYNIFCPFICLFCKMLDVTCFHPKENLFSSTKCLAVLVLPDRAHWTEGGWSACTVLRLLARIVNNLVIHACYVLWTYDKGQIFVLICYEVAAQYECKKGALLHQRQLYWTDGLQRNHTVYYSFPKAFTGWITIQCLGVPPFLMRCLLEKYVLPH